MDEHVYASVLSTLDWIVKGEHSIRIFIKKKTSATECQYWRTVPYHRLFAHGTQYLDIHCSRCLDKWSLFCRNIKTGMRRMNFQYQHQRQIESTNVEYLSHICRKIINLYLLLLHVCISGRVYVKESFWNFWTGIRHMNFQYKYQQQIESTNLIFVSYISVGI